MMMMMMNEVRSYFGMVNNGDDNKSAAADKEYFPVKNCNNKPMMGMVVAVLETELTLGRGLVNWFKEFIVMVIITVTVTFVIACKD